MMSLSAPTDQQKESLDKVFGSYENLNKSLKSDFMGTLTQIFDGLKGNDEELINVFGSSKAVQAAFATAGLQGETYAEVLAGMSEATGNVDEGFKVVSETSGFKFQQALADLKVAAIELGAAIMPMATKVAEFISKAAKSFSGFSDQTKKKILLVVGALALLGPALTVLGTLATLVSALIMPFTLLAGAITACSFPLLLIAGLIALVVGAVGYGVYQMTQNWDAVKKKMVEVVNKFIKMYNESMFVRVAVESLIMGIKNFFATAKFVINSVGNMFTMLGEAVANIFRKKEKRKAAWADFKNSMKADWNDLTTAIEDNFDEAIHNIQHRELEVITEDDIQEYVDKGKEMGNNIIDGVKGVFQQGKDLLSGFMFGPGEDTDLGITGNINLAPASSTELMSQLMNDNYEIVRKTYEEKMKKPIIKWSEETTKIFQETWDGWEKQIGSFQEQYTEGFADMIATTVTEGGNLAENFKNFVVSMVKDISRLIIKMLIFKTLMKALGMGGLDTAVKGGGKFLGSLFGFAEGGLVTGATPVMVGEGRGTSMSNPEVIAPLDKLQSYMGGMGGTARLHGSISGENILLSNQRSLISQNRVGGSITDF